MSCLTGIDAGTDSKWTYFGYRGGPVTGSGATQLLHGQAA